jgi:hypothetical protein
MPRDETVRSEGDVRITRGGEPSCEPDDKVSEANISTRDLVASVTEATWSEALHRLGTAPSNPLPLWTMLATRILRAVAIGERDPERLKRLALDGLGSRDWLNEE